jgi:hypothetical protein
MIKTEWQWIALYSAFSAVALISLLWLLNRGTFSWIQYLIPLLIWAAVVFIAAFAKAYRDGNQKNPDNTKSKGAPNTK